MNILEKILLAQDFDESSQNLTNATITLAKTFKSSITPIHVLPDDILSEKVEGLIKSTVKEKLVHLKNHITDQGISVPETIAASGQAYEAIVKNASLINANVIVVGSGEEKEQAAFKLGTTTERIVQSSEKPVFVVKENQPLNIKKILCPVDFSETSKRALNNAITIARRCNAELVIFSVSEMQTSSWFMSQEDLDTENQSRHQKHQDKFSKFTANFKLKELPHSFQTVQGNPSEQILKAISEHGVDLLIMGTSAKTGLNRLFLGSVTEKVIREVPCSFLTLKSEDVINLQLQEDIKDFEKLYNTGLALENDGFFDEAIEQFKTCLSFNMMHVPAYDAIARVFDKINQPEKAKLYRKNAAEIKDRIWYSKIEEEVRKLRGS